MRRPSGLRLALTVSVSVAIAVSGFLLARRWREVGEVGRLGPNSSTIVPGVHILCGLGPSAAYVVETSEGLVLVDSGLESDAELLKREMAKLGLDWKAIRAILLTHVHGDHCGGAELLRRETNAKVYAGRGDSPPLEAGGPREAFFSTFYMPGHAPHPTHVDVPLEGGESIAFGDVRFQAIAAPGHTPGSVCYLMERGGLRALFAGDVITMLAGEEHPHATGRKPLGTYSAYLSPRYRGDAVDYLKSLSVLRAMPVPGLILPGHPLSDPTPQSPRLSETRWREVLDEGIHEMEALLAHRKDDGAPFLDGHPKRILPDLYYLGDFQGIATYGFFVGAKFFVVDAPGGPGLLDFLNDRLRALGIPGTDPTAVLLTSCNAKDTAGLKELVQRCHASVVAPTGGVATVKAICPPDTQVIPAADLPQMGWFSATTLSLRGRGAFPTAYLLPWRGKQVLLSGRIPILFDHNSTEALTSDLSGSRNDAVEYLLSIEQLEPLHPDVWLPALQSDDQNADLYEGDWKYVISNNYRLGRAILDKFR